MTNNGNMPAMPCDEFSFINASGYRETIRGHEGMSKREMMAMHAPEEPSWFRDKWEDENCQNEHFFGESEDEFECKHVYMTNHGKQAMYFAWRAHYADALLAELERTK